MKDLIIKVKSLPKAATLKPLSLKPQPIFLSIIIKKKQGKTEMSAILSSKINLVDHKSGKQSIAALFEQDNLSDADLKALKEEYLHNNFMRVKLDQYFLKSMKMQGKPSSPKQNSEGSFISLSDLRSHVQEVSNGNVKKLMKMIVSEN